MLVRLISKGFWNQPRLNVGKAQYMATMSVILRSIVVVTDCDGYQV